MTTLILNGHRVPFIWTRLVRPTNNLTALAHCAECDLWLRPEEGCLHMEPVCKGCGEASCRCPDPVFQGVMPPLNTAALRDRTAGTRGGSTSPTVTGASITDGECLGIEDEIDAALDSLSALKSCCIAIRERAA